MTEKLLQYIWQFRLFNQQHLRTLEGQIVQVLVPGQHNTNQGPDFLNAKIIIDQTTWAGSVELHLFSSQWQQHGHEGDKNYSNVVLHVVWQHDKDIKLSFPTLVLEPHIATTLISKYEDMMTGKKFVPCEAFLPAIRNISVVAWKERLLIERLHEKHELINKMLQHNNFHWEETCWWLTARNFGAPVNADAFESIARSIPVNILAKHKHQRIQLEALLYGQAGMLEEDYGEDYPLMLRKEYQFLKHKYGLVTPLVRVQHLRMRPADFPEIRLAQLAALIQKLSHLFNILLETEEIKTLEALYDVTANDYWHYHYKFGEASAFKPKNTGHQFVQRILVNAVIPLVFSYGIRHKNEIYQTKALRWLEMLGAEQNTITKGFASLGLQNKTAHDSQALIQLKNKYCDAKRCLHCAIGHHILKTSKLSS